MPKKRDPNSIVVIPEDTYQRVRKLIDQKIQAKPPKELNEEAWIVPPVMHTMPEFKQVIQYWKQCAVVQYAERKELKVPSKVQQMMDFDVKNPSRRIYKEITEMFKFMKKFMKQAEKRTGQFLKQLMKKEKKEDKRLNLIKQIANFESLMTEETKKACDFAKKQNLFEGMFPPDEEELAKLQALAEAEEAKKAGKISQVHPAPDGEEKPPEAEEKPEPPPDTSAEDLAAVDKMLKTIAGHKKKIAALNKKLDKCDDLTAEVKTDRDNLKVQLALQAMLARDKEIIDFAMTSTQGAPPPEV